MATFRLRKKVDSIWLLVSGATNQILDGIQKKEGLVPFQREGTEALCLFWRQKDNRYRFRGRPLRLKLVISDQLLIVLNPGPTVKLYDASYQIVLIRASEGNRRDAVIVNISKLRTGRYWIQSGLGFGSFVKH